MHLNLWHAEVGLHYKRLTAQTEIKDSLMHMRFQTCWLASPLCVWALCSGVQKKAQSCTCLLMRSPNRHALPQHGVEHLSPGQPWCMCCCTGTPCTGASCACLPLRGRPQGCPGVRLLTVKKPPRLSTPRTTKRLPQPPMEPMLSTLPTLATLRMLPTLPMDQWEPTEPIEAVLAMLPKLVVGHLRVETRIGSRQQR